ncbi:sensor histidine kinase [Lutispora thermophila]|uniref:histidine kinase n=1 Tax=Lutispora thermophila DSM 19022 TaxID=1122184 RepID=A0A1M6C036_9FIRM|nr:HAMP domain-containing sensor histidine kinase [Lutispora thermophila]SHI54357.1 His Kinase A (phospho-acceptor) domain-containing protein [Lutispora thermophila DSM 19022]
MFAKLRNKFLILNLVSISIMMLMAFSSIYIITYKNVSRDINKELNRLSAIERWPIMVSRQPKFEMNMGPARERTASFTIITDDKYKIVKVSSALDMDDEFYEAAKSASISKSAATGRFKYDNSHWAFMMKKNPHGCKIVFLDITPQHRILTNLIYTFLLVAAVMLIFIFLISKTFANKAIQPVEEAFYKQKQFIADASHELKTPLTVINTNVDVLLSNKDEDMENQWKWLYYIKSEVDRMSKLINDLLYLARLDDSRDVIYSAVDLSNAVENVIMTMEALIFENHIGFHYDVESGITVYGNKEQMEQVVMILLDNAVKYSGANGKVDLSLRKSNNYAVLSVSNTGEGIPPESLERIFDRFYRGDKSRARKSGGYGLGLSIAKAIVDLHGGRIYARSGTNEYTTFFVELPLIK